MSLISSSSAFDPAYSFESHFTEIKYGLISGEAGTTDNALRWDVNSATQWNTSLVAGTWYNLLVCSHTVTLPLVLTTFRSAYDIDFSANTVGLWASTGGDDLTQVIEPVSASTSTNSEDWCETLHSLFVCPGPVLSVNHLL